MQGISAEGQCHFFAGIGGWPLALQLAGWPDDRPVWTGSCPCQPFSQAGRGRGFDDERHAWPDWYRLIEEHRPPTIFGEQVAGKAGRQWLDLVFNDLEAIGYACGAVTFPACSVGAPHIRQRLYWVADTHDQGPQRRVHDRRGADKLPAGAGSVAGWSAAEWVQCSDGRQRPVEPGTFPLADGIPARVGRLRGYGNAIVIPQAVEFIKAYMDIMPA